MTANDLYQQRIRERVKLFVDNLKNPEDIVVSEDFFYHSTLASPGGHGTPPREVPAGVLAEAGCHPKEIGGVAPQQALLGGLGK